ncbi:MAG: GAF domain-containing protein [Deltaproteobacteria bacterium]|nr:GAF domain-containing protein [Deltaproteobacteria bacterium]
MKPDKNSHIVPESKNWQLLLIAIAIILYLTLVLLSISYDAIISNSEVATLSKDFYVYTVSVTILVLLFCAYVIITQRKIRMYLVAVEQERRESEKLIRDVEILSSLLEVSSSINSQQQLPNILDIITREMLACFHADRSSIMLLDEAGQTLTTESCYGLGSEYAKNARIAMGKGISGWVAQNGQPLLLNGQVDSARFPGLTQKNAPISSSLCVPLKLADKSIGVLNVNLMNPGRRFEESDLKLITIFANNAAVAIHNSLLLKEKSRRIQLQTMLGQLHSPLVVQKLMEKVGDGGSPNIMREKVDLTVLFSDIRGFSAMLSMTDPELIMGFLDEFYSVMNKAVFENEGSIDKFIGDEVMAFFGAPFPLENAAVNGVKTALEMMTYFESLKEKFTRRSPFFGGLGLGIGINTGLVVAGNVGSASRYEYTVIGTAVNLARRLCAHAEPGQILTTRHTIEKVESCVSSEQMEDVQFKGVNETVTVYRISGANFP